MTTYYPSCGENETSISDALAKLEKIPVKLIEKRLQKLMAFQTMLD